MRLLVVLFESEPPARRHIRDHLVAGISVIGPKAALATTRERAGRRALARPGSPSRAGAMRGHVEGFPLVGSIGA